MLYTHADLKQQWPDTGRATCQSGCGPQAVPPGPRTGPLPLLPRHPPPSTPTTLTPAQLYRSRESRTAPPMPGLLALYACTQSLAPYNSHIHHHEDSLLQYLRHIISTFLGKMCIIIVLK